MSVTFCDVRRFPREDGSSVACVSSRAAGVCERTDAACRKAECPAQALFTERVCCAQRLSR